MPPKSSKPALLAAITLVIINRLFMLLKLRAPIDGWRRGASVTLTNEAARFFLSAFNLKIPAAPAELKINTPEELHSHITRSLSTFLQSQPQFHFYIEQGLPGHKIVRAPGPSFTLRFDPWIDNPARFIRPDNWRGQSGPSLPPNMLPLFEFVARIAGDRQQIDLWLRINHVATDGVLAQEMMSKLEETWTITAPLIFPSPEEFRPCTQPIPTPGRPGIVEVQTFIDFSPILSWRKRQNQNLPEPMTVSAAILWGLARHPAFANLHFGTTAEIPATETLNSGVGILVTRPANYSQKRDGLARYVKHFNRELQLIKTRKSSSCKTLDAAGYLPPKLERILLLHALSIPSTFGSVGITILKSAKVFGAPYGDAGHPNGFIAIGNMTNKSSNGKPLAAVHIKGPEKQIAEYAAVLCEAINQAANDY